MIKNKNSGNSNDGGNNNEVEPNISLQRRRSENDMTLAQESLNMKSMTVAQIWEQIDPKIASKGLKLRFYRTFEFLFPICFLQKFLFKSLKVLIFSGCFHSRQRTLIYIQFSYF